MSSYAIIGIILLVAVIYIASILIADRIRRKRSYHKHNCQQCGYSWWHSDAMMGDVEAHTCSICGQQEWWRR